MHPSELASAFAQRGVRYCIVGGVAVTLHGMLRDTFDLDVLVAPTAENLRRASLSMSDLVPDLVAMKRAAGRPKDLEDAEWLERLGEES